MIQSCLRKIGFCFFISTLISLSAQLHAQTYSSSATVKNLDFSAGIPAQESLLPPSALLNLVGPDTICAGQRDTLSIDFSDGMPPYIFIYSINGMAQAPDTTNSNPYVFLSPVLTAGTAVIQLDSLWADGIMGAVAGMDTITVLPAPTAILESDTVALCLGDTVMLRIQFSGPGPYTFQYAANLDTLPAVTTADTLVLIPITPPAGQTIYRLTAVSGGSCDGMFSGIYDVRVTALPTADLQGDTVLCPGQSTPLTVTFTGTSPFVVNYTANGIPQTPDTSLFNPRIIVVAPSDSTVYSLTSVSSNGCVGTVSGRAIVEIHPGLSAVISGGGQICQGGSGTTIAVNFTGPGPYTFVYRAGLVNQPPITTNSNPLVLNVNPQNGTIYRLVSVTNGVCTGTVSGTATVAVFTPSTAELVGDLTFCDSADTTIMVDFTGSGPFTLVYSANGVLQDTVQTFDDPYFIPVNITSTTIYKLVSVESPGCFGTVVGELTVTINYAPSFNNLNVVCDLTASTYTVEFDVVGATAPLTLVNGTGTFTGTHFVSDPIPIALDYDFSFHDANDCADIVVSGISICNCSSDAGTMDLTPINSCTDTTATAIHNGDHNLDNNDTLLYILHTNPGVPTGQIVAWSSTPSFAFGPGLMPNVTYYISAIAGNPDMTGTIDQTDPCLSISTGTPVIWRVSPTATIDAAFDVCPGQQVFIPVTFTGQAPFTLTYTNNGQSNTVLALQNSFSISASVLDTAIFKAVSVVNAQCPGTAIGQAVVNVHPAPQIINVNAICAPDNLSYTLEFDVIEADPVTIQVSGVPGNFDPASGHFVSDPIPAHILYSAQVADNWQCGLDSISGGGNCACVTDAGLMDQTPMVLCNADTAFGTVSAGFFLAPDDTLLYILASSPSPASWNILAYNQTPEFTFDPGTMVTGAMYYIVAIAGNSTPSGVDFNDACFSYAAGASVIWQEAGTVVLGADTEICQGDTATLAILFTGNAPYNFTYQINGIDQSVLSTSNAQYLLAVSPAISSTYTLSGALANGCPADVSGSAMVTVHAVPQILDTVTSCNLSTLEYTLEFKISNGTAPNPAYTITGLQGTLTDSVFQSVPIPSGQTFNLTVSTPAGCTASLSGAASCMCVTEAGAFGSTALQNICLPGTVSLQPVTGSILGLGDSLAYILYEDPAALPSGIIGTSNLPQFTLQAGMQAGTTYYISAVAGNALPNGMVDLTHPCLSVSPAVPVVFRQPPTASISGDTTICVGRNTIFKINFTGKSPFQFVYSINGVSQSAVSAPQNSFTISTNNVQQTQVFTLISVQDAFCVGTASGTYTVNIQQGPTATLLSSTSICPGDSALLTLQLAGANNFDLTINGGQSPIQLTGVQNGATFQIAPATTTTYSIGTFIAQGNTCMAAIGSPVLVTVAPPLSALATLSDFGGVNVSCSNENDGAISLQINGGLSPVNASWSNGSSGFDLQGLTAGQYSVTLTDNLGCSYQDSFLLTAPEEIVLAVQLRHPKCFGDRNGSILVQNVQGGLGPFAISLNGLPAQITDVFPMPIPDLPAGSYSLLVEDVNGCMASLDTSLMEPPLLTLDLGPDATLYPGDSILLNPVVGGVPLDSFIWTPSIGLNQPMVLSTFARPEQSIIYALWVQDTAGCQAEDAIRILVRKDYRLYVPNVIMPGAADPNGVLAIYAGTEVANIRVFRVYDRWGSNVFEGLNVAPNNTAQGWNGKWRGQDVQPGVYVWMIELEFLDGTTEIKSGEVTVLR